MTDTSTRTLGRRAVVVGAGMGGMMAAEVLSRHFGEVVVLEKDTLPAKAEPRMGVPQGAHVHALLVQGRRNVETLFPGLTSRMIDQGAVCSRAGLEFRMRDAGGWQPLRDLHLTLLTMSRPLLEETVRGMLRANPRVTIRDDVRVGGWRFAGDKLTGVVIEGGETLDTDFVVDASGRSGNSLSWLEAGGFGPVEETRLEIGTGYASAIFRKPADWHGEIDSFSISAADPDTRGGFLFAIEDECWAVSLTGRFDQQPSGDPEKFMAFAQSLCEPELYDRIRGAERLTPIRTYKAPISRWRRYEKLARHPEGIVPLGDALAHVNPVYGQGMALASVHALGLGEVLAERAAGDGSLKNVAAPYLEKTHAFTKAVWEGLENIEFTYAGTRGERPADIDMRIAYLGGVRRLIESDAEVHRLLLGIGHLVQPPEALLRPDIAARVMPLLAQA